MRTLREQIEVYRPAIALERVLSRKTQNILRPLFFLASFSFLLIATLSPYILPEIPVTLWWGAALICTVLWIDQILTTSYHNSFYYRGLESVIADEQVVRNDVTYDVAEVVLRDPEDVTRAFCESLAGKNVLLRAGIMPKELEEFLRETRRAINADMVILPENRIFTLIDLGNYLLGHDSDFASLFTKRGIPASHFVNSLRWVIGTHHQQKRMARWWSKDNLSKTNGLGREWAYGVAYTLQRFSRDISTSAVFSTLSANPALAEEKIAEIETSLAKGKSANVLVIGEAGVGKMDLVMAVQKRMEQGRALQSIVGQHIYVLDVNRLFAVHPRKADLEQAIIRLFDEALAAGNTIIVIENLSTVIREAEQYGVFIPELLDEYLSSPFLHVIATDTPGGFHQFLEPLGGFTRRFSEVLIETTDNTATTRVLEGVALTTEARNGVIFTYGSLDATTTAADRYLVEGVLPDKAIELLLEVAAVAKQNNQVLITDDLVYQVVSDKTKVPAGPIKDEERDLLLHLEDTLHRQVVGQERAIDAISKTMRRARAGIQASDKPIGSFLFLGPTGVGKTETAKALAKVFFGDESKLERLDMSEFSGPDALFKLIGDGEHSGILADTLREHPYCVLLLDELEKANEEVHDLFLQILDEGIFTDSRGTKVNARNTIIIATSNAGASLILRTVQQRQELSHLAEQIINHIIEAGIFKPELINRFDSTIIFEPLTITEQSEVANLMLKGLYDRVKGRGYQLDIGRDLIDILVQKGYDPEFGARPMQRVIQDVLEEKLAQKIISGEAQRGDTIHLSMSDFSEAELSS